MGNRKTNIIKGKYPYEVFGIGRKRSMEISGEIKKLMTVDMLKMVSPIAYGQIKVMLERYEGNELLYAFIMMGICIGSSSSTLLSITKKETEAENVRYH